jgi:alanine racemase
MLPTFAEINLSNLKFNFLNIRKKVKNSKVMAVVKANAYGHGMLECVSYLSKLTNKPDYYGVTFLEEAIELRKANIIQPILVFTPIYNSNVEDYFKYDVIPTIFTRAHIDLIKGKSDGRKMKVHIKIDTGMGRLGIRYDEALEFIDYFLKQKDFVFDGIYSHFATSDEANKEFAKLQFKRFKVILAELKRKKINYGLAHMANTGAILDMPESYLDMVRPGISLYGYYPSRLTSESFKLKPAMSLITHVSAIKKIKKGESVSYGRKFIASKNTRVAVAPFGYAGGYFRALSNKSYGIINGKKYKQVGQICMDLVMFDIGNDKINTGDKIILLGKQNKSEINIWDWVEKVNTIPYEIICNFCPRVPRKFIE